MKKRKEKTRTKDPSAPSESETLLRIAKAIATLDLDQVVARAAEMTRRALHARRAILYLVTPDRKTLELVATTERTPKSVPRHWALNAIGPITFQVIRDGRVANVRDFKTDPRGTDDVEPALAFRSFVAVPVQSGRERLGCLQVGETRRARSFTAREIAFVRGVADQVAVAVKNARLARESAERLETLRGISARLFSVQEEERARIARELHDEAGQSLTAMKLNLDLARREVPPGAALERLDEVSRLAQEVLEELRRIARDLRPRALDELGLLPALTVLVDGFRKRLGVAVEVDFAKEVPLDKDAASTAFRFVQEALTNVATHAQARRVVVRVMRSRDQVVFSVTDDGVGFDPGKVASRGMGLLGMRERAALAAGRVQVTSRPKHGTEVRLHLPVTKFHSTG